MLNNSEKNNFFDCSAALSVAYRALFKLGPHAAGSCFLLIAVININNRFYFSTESHLNYLLALFWQRAKYHVACSGVRAISIYFIFLLSIYFLDVAFNDSHPFIYIYFSFFFLLAFNPSLIFISSFVETRKVFVQVLQVDHKGAIIDLKIASCLFQSLALVRIERWLFCHTIRLL